MGYFKTLTIDPSAARTYHQRWAQSDQAGKCNKSHLVDDHETSSLTTATTIAPAVPVSITREHVGRALREWRRNVQHNPRDLSAVNRAALNLEACLWYMTPDGELVITSATDSRTRYHVNPDGCDCRAASAGRACWHVAAYKILHTVDAMRRLEAPQKATERDMQYVQVLVDELV